MTSQFQNLLGNNNNNNVNCDVDVDVDLGRTRHARH